MSAPDAGVERVEAHAVDEFGRPLDIPDREVGALAGLQRAGLRRPGRAPRAAWRVTPSRHSSTVMPNSVAAMFMVSSSEVSGEVPGLQSVATAIATPCRAEQLDRRLLRLADEIEGAGQNHRDRPGLRHGPGAGLVGIFEMIGRQRAISSGECGAAQVGKLVGMQLDRQAERPGRIENYRSICSGEKAMPSQKPSTASASPSAAMAGRISAGDPDR